MVKEVTVSHILLGSQEKAQELLNKIKASYNFKK